MPIPEPMTVAEMEWEGGHQSQPSSTAEDMGKWLSEEMWTTRQKDSARLPGPAFGCLTATHGFHTHTAHCFSKGTSCEISWLKLDPSSIFRQCANLVKWFFFVQWSVGKQEVKPHPMYIRTEKTEKFQNAKDIQWLPGLTPISLFGQKWQRLPILQWSGGLGLPQFHFLRGSPCPLFLWEPFHRTAQL